MGWLQVSQMLVNVIGEKPPETANFNKPILKIKPQLVVIIIEFILEGFFINLKNKEHKPKIKVSIIVILQEKAKLKLFKVIRLKE
jgi:hypothetical protein